MDKSGTTKAYIFRACFIDPFQGIVGAKFAIKTLRVECQIVHLVTGRSLLVHHHCALSAAGLCDCQLDFLGSDLLEDPGEGCVLSPSWPGVVVPWQLLALLVPVRVLPALTAAPGRPRMPVACQIAAVIRLPRLLVRPTSMGKEGGSEIVFQRTWSSQTLRK